MIPKSCIENIMSIHPEAMRLGMVNMFNTMVKDTAEKDLPSATLVIPFYSEECDLQPGDYAPEMHLVIRRVDEYEDRQESATGAEEPDPSSHEQADNKGAEEAAA